MTIYQIVAAAKKLGIDRATLFRHIRAGKEYPGAVRDASTGRVIGFIKSELDAFVENVK